jgi:hypothetical protein
VIACASVTNDAVRRRIEAVRGARDRACRQTIGKIIQVDADVG